MPSKNLAKQTASGMVGALARRKLGQYSPEPLLTLGNAADAVLRKGQSPSTLLRQVPGAVNQLGSIQFTAAFNQYGDIAHIMSSGFDSALNRYPDGTNIPDAYRVLIESKSLARTGSLIAGSLQEKLVLRITSDWEPIINKQVSNLVESILQASTGRSAASEITSRRIWRGTTPLKLDILLKFEAVVDAYREVTEPARKLQQLAAPTKGDNVLRGDVKIPLLEPPGPSPFREIGRDSEQINIRIGPKWFFSNVILREVAVEYSTEVTPDGDPISAEARLEFETYEIITKEKIKEFMEGTTETIPGAKA